MGACFGVLKILLGDNILHYQCWAHKVNLVGDVFLKEFKELNSIVPKTKSAFLHSRKMKSAYLNFLKEKSPQLAAKLYPEPVITRWNSWFKSVVYLSEYMDYIVAFFKEYEGDNSSTSFVKETFQNEILAHKVRVQMTYVAEFCQKVVQLIEHLERVKISVRTSFVE